MFNIAVLSSGHSRGSNLRAIAEYFRVNNLPVKIAFVIRTVADAPITEVCDEYNLTCHHLSIRDKDKFEAKVKYLTEYHQVHLIALAGFLKCLSSDFIDTVNVPVLNIHPALLPRFGGKGMYGIAVHRAVLAAGDIVSGPSVHIVNSAYDEGEIIAQEKVDVSACHTAEEIASLVLMAEHRLYGRAIWAYLKKLYS